MDFWDFHTKGNVECEACVVAPERCDVCNGLVHTQLDDEFDTVLARCDFCSSIDVPDAVGEVGGAK